MTPSASSRRAGLPASFDFDGPHPTADRLADELADIVVAVRLADATLRLRWDAEGLGVVLGPVSGHAAMAVEAALAAAPRLRAPGPLAGIRLLVRPNGGVASHTLDFRRFQLRQHMQWSGATPRAMLRRYCHLLDRHPLLAGSSLAPTKTGRHFAVAGLRNTDLAVANITGTDQAATIRAALAHAGLFRAMLGRRERVELARVSRGSAEQLTKATLDRHEALARLVRLDLPAVPS